MDITHMRTLSLVMKPEDLTDANIRLKKTSAGFFKELFETFGKADAETSTTCCRKLK